jgi:hypothetical protein
LFSPSVAVLKPELCTRNWLINFNDNDLPVPSYLN